MWYILMYLYIGFCTLIGLSLYYDSDAYEVDFEDRLFYFILWPLALISLVAEWYLLLVKGIKDLMRCAEHERKEKKHE